jgi:hypothetical protein
MHPHLNKCLPLSDLTSFFRWRNSPTRASAASLLRFLDRTHTHTHTLRHKNSVGLLRDSDQLVAEAGTYTTYNQHNRPCPQRDSNSRSQQSRGDRPTLFFLWRRTPQQILRTHRSLKAYCATLVIKMERKISSFFFIFPSNGVPVE